MRTPPPYAGIRGDAIFDVSTDYNCCLYHKQGPENRRKNEQGDIEMAGDLFIENLSFSQKLTLTEAGAVDGLQIFHADRPFSAQGLAGRLALPSRVGLPAHAYLTFKGGSDLQGDYKTNGIYRLRLNDILVKCSRPAFMSQKASLNGWPGVGQLSAVLMLEQALQGGSIIIEYYKYDDRPILTVFSTWARLNE